MSPHDIEPGSAFRHKKTGSYYTVMCIAKYEHDASHAVVYQSLSTSQAWVRPFDDFISKFELEPRFHPGC